MCKIGSRQFILSLFEPTGNLHVSNRRARWIEFLFRLERDIASDVWGLRCITQLLLNLIKL